MSERKAIAKNKNLAFKVYCEMGGNVERTLAELELRGLRLTKKTLYRWIEKFRFEERRLEVDLEKQRAEDSQLSFEEKMLAGLMEQKKKYEKHFKKSEKPDTQDMHAYTNLCKTIIAIRDKTAASRTADEVEKIVKKQGLSDEAAEDIRSKILGINS